MKSEASTQRNRSWGAQVVRQGAGRQSGTVQRLAHQQVPRFVWTPMVFRWAESFSQPPLAWYVRHTLARCHVSGMFEAGDSVMEQQGERGLKKTNNSCLGFVLVVTRGLMFVCFHCSLLPCQSVGVQTGEPREHRHHQPNMPVDVIARHGEGREDDRPKEQSQRSCRTSLSSCTAPENVSRAPRLRSHGSNQWLTGHQNHAAGNTQLHLRKMAVAV